MKRAVVVLVGLCAGCGRIGLDPVATRDATADDDATDATDATGGSRCGSESSLVACYAFDGDTLDSSGFGNHATGAVNYLPGGHAGQGVRFDDTTDLRVADSPSLDVPDHVTVMAWVRIDMLPTTEVRSVILDRNLGFALFVRDAGMAGFGLSLTPTGGGTNDPTPFPLSVWTHIAATYDGAQVRLYVAGAQVAMSAATGAITSADTQGSRIGGNLPDSTATTPQVLYGAIDELGVWNEALSAARISDAALQ